MSRARTIADFGDGIATADIDDGAVTAGKLNSTLDLTGKTVTLPAGVGGKVLQVVANNEQSVQFSTTSTSYVTFTTAPEATITPSSTSSKIVIIARIGMQWDSGGQIENTIYRAISGGATTDLSASNTYGVSFHGSSAGSGNWKETTISYTDSPNTTSAITYTWYARSEAGGTIYPDHGGAVNSMILMEIAG